METLLHRTYILRLLCTKKKKLSMQFELKKYVVEIYTDSGANYLFYNPI